MGNTSVKSPNEAATSTETCRNNFTQDHKEKREESMKSLMKRSASGADIEEKTMTQLFSIEKLAQVCVLFQNDNSNSLQFNTMNFFFI